MFFVSEGLLPYITSIVMLSQDAVFASDYITFFMDLDVESYFGYETYAMPAKQLRQLQLDDPRITDKYRQQLHTLCISRTTAYTDASQRSLQGASPMNGQL
jgi:hypothetical protein